MLNFPQELLHCVVDCFQYDPSALATVRLVSRAWNFSATPLLFRSLDLLFSVPPTTTHSCHRPSLKYSAITKLQSLLSLLDASPHISQCVRQVSLGRTSTLDSVSHSNLTLYALLISSTLRRFTRLSDVVFQEINWANLSPSFLSCIQEISNLPTLERIELWNCQMPTTSCLFHILGTATNVKRLRLSYFRIGAADSDLGDSKLSPFPSPGEVRSIHRPCHTDPFTSLLHSLALDEAWALNYICSSSITFLNLRQLYLGSVHNTAAVAEFLQKAGHSLDFLHMRLIPSTQTKARLSAVNLDLSHCPRLQRLRVSGLHWTPSICPSEYLSSLFTNQSLPIQSLQLMVTAMRHKVMTPVGLTSSDSQIDSESAAPPMRSRPTELQYSDWSILDTILSSPSFHALKSFQISLQTIREHEVDPSRLSDMFPSLKDRGVQVTCT